MGTGKARDRSPMSGTDTVRRNLDKQREYYGELFGERARRLVVGFDIS
jgi:hypothetical protein